MSKELYFKYHQQKLARRRNIDAALQAAYKEEQTGKRVPPPTGMSLPRWRNMIKAATKLNNGDM